MQHVLNCMPNCGPTADGTPSSHTGEKSNNYTLRTSKFLKSLSPLEQIAINKYPQDIQVQVGQMKSSSSSSTSRSMSNKLVDLAALRELLWNGAPNAEIRGLCWRLLLHVAPNARDRYGPTLEKKRREYHELATSNMNYADEEQVLLRQIKVDLPRTNCGYLQELFLEEPMQDMMERILFVWAIRHPACGYVQGINDLLVPFIVVFLMAEVGEDLMNMPISKVPPDARDNVEADSYYCLTRLLDSIQDNYTPGQPGIQRMVADLGSQVKQIDVDLYNVLEENGCDFLQFSFRWMNCLLAREFPMACVIRLWDTYIAEIAAAAVGTTDFTQFHTYMCAVFLIFYAPSIKKTENFQDLMIFLQKFPTAHWRDTDIEVMLSSAHLLKTLLTQKNTPTPYPAPQQVPSNGNAAEQASQNKPRGFLGLF